MKELSFDSGLVTYSLNGKCEVSFNPTDSNFVEKLYSAFEELDKKQEGYKAQIEKIADTDVRSRQRLLHEEHSAPLHYAGKSSPHTARKDQYIVVLLSCLFS